MKLNTIALALLVASASISSAMADAYSTGFEDFTLGPISPVGPTGPSQGGWSGGAQGGFTNSDAGDEQVVNTTIHSGSQSWHYARGYNSPGQGTAFTPNLTTPLDAVGETMNCSLWFKAHTGADGSSIAIETGNVAGDDRAEIIAYVSNVQGGLTVSSFDDGAFTPVPIASGLDNSVWHQLSFSMTRTATGNDVSVSVDNGTPVSFLGGLGEFREDILAPYSESSRLKFRPRHADGDPTFNGFFLDDISYSVAVPEPTTLAALGSAGILGLRRRRRA